MKRYTFIIGNAWGLRTEDEEAMHYWTFIGDGLWATSCGNFRKSHDDEFDGVKAIELFFDADHAKCEECLDNFMNTDYGREHGVKPPYVNSPPEE